MRVIQGPGHFGRDPERLLHWELLLTHEPLPKRLALDKRHGEPELARRLPRVVNRKDVRVLQPGRKLDLSLEPLRSQRVGQFGKEHLERDRPVVPQVLGEEDGGHAAPPELAPEGVGWGQGLLQLRAEVRHRTRMC